MITLTFNFRFGPSVTTTCEDVRYTVDTNRKIKDIDILNPEGTYADYINLDELTSIMVTPIPDERAGTVAVSR